MCVCVFFVVVFVVVFFNMNQYVSSATVFPCPSRQAQTTPLEFRMLTEPIDDNKRMQDHELHELSAIGGDQEVYLWTVSVLVHPACAFRASIYVVCLYLFMLCTQLHMVEPYTRVHVKYPVEGHRAILMVGLGPGVDAGVHVRTMFSVHPMLGAARTVEGDRAADTVARGVNISCVILSVCV